MSESGARLIRADCQSRMKDSPKLQVRFLCCALTTIRSVFTQSGSFATKTRCPPHVRFTPVSDHLAPESGHAPATMELSGRASGRSLAIIKRPHAVAAP